MITSVVKKEGINVPEEIEQQNEKTNGITCYLMWFYAMQGETSTDRLL